MNYKPLINTNNLIIAIIVLVIIASLFLYYSSVPISNQFSSYNGNVDFINFTGQNSNMQFKAKGIYFITNETVFYSIKNITVESSSGELRLINYTSSLQVQYNEEVYQQLKNVDIGIYFVNLTMVKWLDYGRINLYGHMNMQSPNHLKSNGEVFIPRIGINYVFIGDEKFTDFRLISFEMDNTSSVNFFSEIIKMEAYTVSDLKITGQLSKITLYQGDGVFGLNNHLFNIRRTDVLDIEVLPNYIGQSLLTIDGTKIIFSGTANSAKSNNEDLIMSDFHYWFKIQPEKINAYSSAISAVVAVVLVFLTFFNVRSTQKLVSLEAEKKKHEKQKFLNILLAELETNSILIEDAKKSFDRLNREEAFGFLGFKEDGFNTFRNQGGFQYITSELYTKIAGYYNSLNRISNKITPEFIDLTNEEFNSEITLIENLNNELKSEIETERHKQ